MLRSRSRLSKCRPPPRPRISTTRISRGVARRKIGYQLHGHVIAAPFRELDPQDVLFRTVHSWLCFHRTLPGSERPSEIRTQLLLYPPRC